MDMKRNKKIYAVLNRYNKQRKPDNAVLQLMSFHM